MTEHVGGPAAILVNRGAGTAHSARVQASIDAARAAMNAEVHEVETRDAAVLEAWLHERLDTHAYRTVVVVGGDGSLGVTYNVVAGRDVAVGYIPAGFGNATSHLLHLPADPQALTAVLAAGDARPIDLVAVDHRLALFAGAGWDALVARRYAAAGAHRLRGWAAAVARSVPDLFRRREVRVDVDGTVVHEGPVELIVVGTTPYYGRGLLVNPGARPDAGRLVARVYPGPVPAFALEAARWVVRRRPAAPALPGTRVELTTLDGRPLAVQADGDALEERAHWDFEIRPAAVRLIGRWRRDAQP